MRKREIHSVAHWAMMFLLLMFPILMVGLSVIQSYPDNATQQYEDQVVNSVDDLTGGQTYYLRNLYANNTTGNIGNSSNCIFVDNFEVVQNTTQFDLSNTFKIGFYQNPNGNNIGYYFWYDNSNNYNVSSNSGTVVVKFSYLSNNLTTNNVLNNSNCLYKKVLVADTLNYKQDVNYWINTFIDLPINSWYKSLMNVIGIGFTSSSVMNVIYVMPIYILWVFIFDVIVDCFLVIIKLPHKLLNRLSGGENE